MESEESGVWELTGEVVPAKGHADVDQVIQPSWHDGLAVVRDGTDEFRLEQLVAIEEDVVGVPATSGCNYAWAEISKRKLEGLSIVASNLGLLLCGS